MYQLSPIPYRNDTDKDIYIFESKEWQTMNLKTVELTQVIRQSEEKFINILNQIRIGQMTEEIKQFVNEMSIKLPYPDKYYIKLYCKNIDKDRANELALQAIKNPLMVFKTQDYGKGFLLKNIRAEKIIKLKVGAKVMLLVNKPEHGLFNGSIGVVTQFSYHKYTIGTETVFEKVPVVRFNNGAVLHVGRNKWEIKDRVSYGFKVIASRCQIPLAPAYAVTIHKIQGLSFDYVECDFEGCFTDGLVYVALSRCTSTSGLIIRNFSDKFIKKNEKVYNFYKRLIDC
jgi:hypothetical protein